MHYLSTTPVRAPHTKASSTQRNKEVDIARGLAIFSVVFAHIITGFTSQMIYLFHMPFFFMVSGYFHKVREQEGRYFRQKCLSLLVPYAVYLYILNLPLLSKLISRIVENPSAEGVVNFIKMLIKLLYGGETLKGTTGVFWFVTCLFLVQQLFNFLSNRIRSQRRLFSIAIALYGLAFLDQISPIHIVAPFAANVVACAFTFYATGAFFGRYLFSNGLTPRHNNRLFVAAIAITLLSAVLIRSGIALHFDMKHAYYGYFILSPIAAVSMTKLLMRGSQMLVKFQLAGNTLARVGTMSLTIMYVHRALEFALPTILYRVPFIQSLIITAICVLLHGAFSTHRWTSVLFLGHKLKEDKKAVLMN